MKAQIKENKSENINKLKESDFSVTKFSKDLSYGKKHEKLVMKSMENFELKTDRMAKGDRHLFSIHIPLSRLKKLVSKDYRVMPGGDKLTSRGYLVPLTDLIGV